MLHRPVRGVFSVLVCREGSQSGEWRVFLGLFPDWFEPQRIPHFITNNSRDVFAFFNIYKPLLRAPPSLPPAAAGAAAVDAKDTARTPVVHTDINADDINPAYIVDNGVINTGDIGVTAHTDATVKSTATTDVGMRWTTRGNIPSLQQDTKQ
jgi:hypothetical protein